MVISLMNNKKNKIFVIGAGGHAFSAIDVIQVAGYEIEGVFGLETDIGKKILGHKVLGTQFELSKKIKSNDNLHIAVGHTYDSNQRSKIFELFDGKCVFPSIISPYSYISDSSYIDQGSIIMHGTKICADVKIGSNSIINTNAVIDHNSTIGNFCHISTSVTINGNVNIHDNVFIGSGSVVKESINILPNQSFKMCSKIVSSK